MRNAVIAALAAAILATPAATATWSVIGSYEPDTDADRLGGSMYVAGDVDPNPNVRKVYFNGVPMASNMLGGGTNPNSATLQTRILPPGAFGVMAFLGVWKDCNADGAVGQLESALFEYRAELLSTNICPVGGEFNDGSWVYEFLPIGRGDGETRNDPARWIDDPESQVWADFGRPGVREDVHFDCATYPLPAGTTASTGGLLSYADCSTSYSVAGYVNTLDPTGELAFEDPYNIEEDCDHPLNQPIAGGTFGNAACDWGTGGLESGADDPAYVVYDCDAEPVVVEDPAGPQSIADPTGGDLALVFGDSGTLTVEIGDQTSPAPNLDPSTANPDGSYVEALGYATSGCASSGEELAILGQLVEADFGGTNPSQGKRQSDFPLAFGENPSTFWTLGFLDLRRGSVCEPFLLGACGAEAVPAAAGYCSFVSVDCAPVASNVMDACGAAGTCAAAQITDTLGEDTPGSLGIAALSSATNTLLSEWPVWSTGLFYSPPAYHGNTVRGDGQPAGAQWFTSYAHVGTATLTTTQVLGTAATYGSEACQGHISGVRNGWDCDPTHWWNPTMGGTDYASFLGDGDATRPGQTTYQLRDNDCYDGQLVGGTPVYASGALVSPDGTCA